MSKDYPTQWGQSPQYRNPEGTNPFPQAQDIPIADWNVTVDLDWGNAAIMGNPDGHQWTTTWSSPLFDLQPWLRSADNASRQGKAIWNRQARLFVVLTTSPTNVPFPSSGLAAQATDFVSTSQAASVPRVAEGGLTASPDVSNVGTNDVTAQFTPSALAFTQAVQTGFAPPGNNLGFGEGHPIRYWRIRLTFTFSNETGLPVPAAPAIGAAGAPPFIKLSAAMY